MLLEDIIQFLETSKKFCRGIGFSSDTGRCQLLYILLGREHDRNQIVTQFRKKKKIKESFKSEFKLIWKKFTLKDTWMIPVR